ncbi:MAG: hypothetical protein PVH61_25675 [Candidatus Aminicenantes bacterium]|jgi:hypothetical protein
MAYNNKVFTGADGVMVLSREEGSAADEVLDEYEIEQVGRVKGIELYAHQDIRRFYSIGTNLPTEMRTGNIKIWGKIKRAYINGALLRLLLGKYALAGENPSSPIDAPAFDINIQLKTPDIPTDGPDHLSRITINHVILDNWSFAVPEDDFVLEEVTFQALRILAHDEQLPE